MEERFRIDWGNLPKLRSRPRLQNDRDKLVRCRKGPKNHSVNREKSFCDRSRASKLKHEAELRSEEHQAFKAKVRAYWQGNRDNYPERQP